MQLIDQGRAHLASGEFNHATAAFWAATQQQPGLSAWFWLGTSLALAGDWEDLLRVVNGIKSPVLYFQYICVGLVERGAYDVLGRMHRSIPPNHVVSPVAAYYAGVSLIAAKHHVKSLEHFHMFSRQVMSKLHYYRPIFQGDENFNLIFRQGTLVEPLSYVAALDDGTIPVETPCPAMEFQQCVPLGGPAILFACCLNDLYFHRFADSLISTLHQACGAVELHFHVVGDQQDCLGLFATLEARYPAMTLGLSLEREPFARNSVYYACNRFIVLPKLIEAYDRNIMMLDADALVLQDISRLAEQLSSKTVAADFACFDTGRTEPASVYQATLMYFAKTPDCRAFLQLMRRYIFSKLGGSLTLSWMLDQAALFSVMCYLEGREGSAFTFQRLDKLTGGGLADFVDSAGTQAEKSSLMIAGSDST